MNTMKKLLLGTASVLALGICGAALDLSADADDAPNAIRNMPSAESSQHWLNTANPSKDDIRWAQVKLYMMGLYTGSLDGIPGPKTKQALAQFQKSNGLDQTALLDLPTADALIGGDNAGQGSSMLDDAKTGPMTHFGTSDFDSRPDQR
jgi:peptidoglycan hydrolase-like protein with peptidoglycan-binding domain